MELSLPQHPGTYLLLIDILSDFRIRVGRLGEVPFSKGCYCYVGSAYGPGGLARRIYRHLRQQKRLFWHIDYLLSQPVARISNIIIFVQQRIEHQLACRLASVFEFIPKFGASDSPCASHLFRVDRVDALYNIINAYRYKIYRVPVIPDGKSFCSSFPFPD